MKESQKSNNIFILISATMNYKNIQAFIDSLNLSNIPYVILRNYDSLLEDDIYMDGHGDIDVLCQNSNDLAQAVCAKPQEFHMKKGKADGTHYFIYVNGDYCSLDLRSIGDGYYCENWQKDILDRRVLSHGFYVPHPEDYFYSLIYHAVFQKKFLSEEYRNRLKEMGFALGLNIAEDSSSYFVSLLENFMRQKRYYYEYPVDRYVPLYIQRIEDKSLLKRHFVRFWQHFLFETKVKSIEKLVKIKHFLKGW